MFKVVNSDPIAVSAFDSELPPEIDRVVSQAIAKDPTQRYQSGMEMAQVSQQLGEHYDLIHETAAALANVATIKVEKNLPNSAASSLSEISFSSSGFAATTFDVGLSHATSGAQGEGAGLSPTQAKKHFNAADRMAWVGVIGILVASTLAFWIFSHQRLARPADPPVLVAHQSSPAAPSLNGGISNRTPPALRITVDRGARRQQSTAKTVASALPAEKTTNSPVALSNLQLE